jgi:pimeloyl-ACP methyl ester carboxylesterase
MGITEFVTERLVRRERAGGESTAEAEGSGGTERTALELAEEMAANPRTVTLRDGRELGYSECGDPDGDPLVVYHGFPNSRVFGALFDEAGRERGFRPGYGASDPDPDRSLTDWPDDIRDLFDALGIDRAVALGLSGGGPYAGVTAARLDDRIDRTAIVCGLAPMASVGLRERLWYYTARFAPPLSKLAMWGLVRSVRTDGEGFRSDLAEDAGPPDDDLWTGETGRVIHRSALVAAEQGLDHLVQDTAIYGSPWGFDLSEIEMPVGLWYPREDILVPPEMGFYLAREIPHAEAHFYPGQDHLSIYEFNEGEILAFLSGGA